MFCNKILVAFDGSELSEKALDKAVKIAQTSPDIALHVIMVIKFNAFIAGAYPVTTENVYESDLLYGNEIVKRLEGELSQLENPHSVSLIQGSPENEILHFAKEQGSDLIIMGSRGLTGLKEMLLGSVSHYVVQHAEVPVLIIK
ncbi:universal stress protein [Paenibacillus radicis (ex Xue et al. 2023)]|uniref:Universal stress protein n=1 Tax=Paenibacillus radicis (ex Xue et al. 2023) TaxID=2972489 RepID=A0ABT1YTF8_9BACL|nr:universal stress protein [Paenibacillus radicis (ex Xue et al. 2023)]MCR8636471.1 universal stress protein [Paenibacillus radicis (ex Xue et al. 2023)]